MARIARVVVADFPRQVVQRGGRRMDDFFSAGYFRGQYTAIECIAPAS